MYNIHMCVNLILFLALHKQTPLLNSGRLGLQFPSSLLPKISFSSNKVGLNTRPLFLPVSYGEYCFFMVFYEQKNVKVFVDYKKHTI